MQILITGSSGMIGSALIDELHLRGYHTKGVDRVNPLYSHPDIFFKHDILNPYFPETQVDLVIHLAANARVDELVKDPSRALENLITTHNVFERCRKHKTPLLVASSREIYGNEKESPVKEGVGSQRDSESPYSVSKLALEGYAWAYERCYDMDVKIVRFSNVYGKYDNSNRFIPLAIRKLLKGEAFTVYGGDKVLDFTHIDDCIQGIMLLIENWKSLKYKEYNVASGKASQLVEVAKKLKRELDSKSEILIGSSRKGEVVKYTADISRMKELGFKPKVSIDEGIRKSIEYYVAM